MTPEAMRAYIREGAEIARDVMLRDQFAMMAMQGMLAGDLPVLKNNSASVLANASYAIADAMLEARK